MTEILIIGGGTMGLAIALELHWRGATVTVLSRNFQEAAAHAAAGMLAPQAEQLPPSPLFDLCLQSRALYPDWIAKLEAFTGLSTGYWPCGILTPLYQQPDFTAPTPLSYSPNCHWLDRVTIQQQQPGLSDQVVGGWWFPDDGQVDNQALAQVLRLAVQNSGIDWREGVEVQQIHHHNDQVTHLSTSSGNWRAEHYILATGAWSASLLPLPVAPRKGQMLSIISPQFPPEQPLRHVLFGEQIYIVPRQDGRIILGATNESVGFTPGNTLAGTGGLMQAAQRLYPALADWPIAQLWWGFRPTTPNELPILGASPYTNLSLATGHHRNGILLAPITAQLIADWVLEGKAGGMVKSQW